MSHRLRRFLIAAAAIAVVLGVGFAVYNFGQHQGWFVKRLAPGQLSALLRPHDIVTIPDGAGPFPTGLIFSGCDGLRDNVRTWADMLKDEGWASIIVDSHAPRELTDPSEWRAICVGQTFWGAERAGDVLVSIADARAMPFVDPDRIVLIGSSHGGWSIMDLFVFDPPERLPFNLSSLPQGFEPRRFDGIVGSLLLYPYCGVGNRARGVGWRHPAPGLFLLAGNDYLAPPRDCIAIAEQLRERGTDAQTHIFEGVTHGFDQAERAGLSILEYDAAASAAALDMGRDFLRRVAQDSAGEN